MIGTRGFTLLEVLLAAALTAMIAVAAASWLGAQARVTTAATARLNAIAAASAAARLIDDDLHGAVAMVDDLATVVDTEALTFVSMASAPGDPPGRKRVRWRFDRQQGLLRSVDDGPARVVTARLAGAQFVRIGRDDLRLRALLAEGGEVLDLPLWSP